MASQNTFIVQRVALRRILTAMHVDDKSIEALLAAMEKSHRHFNAMAFVSQLEKIGLERDQVANVLRRIGLDDIAIANVFEMVDVQKISAETGRVYNIVLDFS
ncbi:MAG: hypothetical protein ACP5UH_00085 [Candidatus Micrarchaeia archaeon]